MGSSVVCGSVNQRKFDSEVGIHFPGLGNIKKTPVLVFRCFLNC